MAKATAPEKAPALPQKEIADLAKFARSAWDAGELRQAIDSQGAVWEFEPCRDANSRLIVRRLGRIPPDEGLSLLASGQIGQTDLNRDDTNVVIAATLNAISEPA